MNQVRSNIKIFYQMSVFWVLCLLPIFQHHIKAETDNSVKSANELETSDFGIDDFDISFDPDSKKADSQVVDSSVIKAKLALIERKKNEKDTVYWDSFIFIGRHDSSNLVLHFAIHRESCFDTNRTRFSQFIGGAYWKKNWFNLTQKRQTISELQKRIFPSEPVYEFRWPNSSQHGEFLYHYDRLYLSMAFLPPSPLLSIAATKNESSDLFIGNASVQGINHRIGGVLLYHRTRLYRKTPIQKDSTQWPFDKTGTFLLVNAPGGETYLSWRGFPFPGKGLSKNFLKINWEGKLISDNREVEFIRKLGEDTAITDQQPIQWNWQVPTIDYQLQLTSPSYSPRYGSFQYFEINGTVKWRRFMQKVTGIIIQSHLTEKEIVIDTAKTEDELEQEEKEKKKIKWWKIKRKPNTVKTRKDGDTLGTNPKSKKQRLFRLKRSKKK